MLDGTSFAVNAETLVRDGSPYPPGEGSDRARAFAGLSARFITLAPRPDQVPDLASPPAWINWDHAFAERWPPPDNRDIDMNNLPESGWLGRFGISARGRLVTTRATAPVRALRLGIAQPGLP